MLMAAESQDAPSGGYGNISDTLDQLQTDEDDYSNLEEESSDISPEALSELLGEEPEKEKPKELNPFEWLKNYIQLPLRFESMDKMVI